MVDRYGFVYDVRTGMKLLRAARKRKERLEGGGGEDDEDEVALATVGADGGPPGHEVRTDRMHVELEAELETLREALGLPPSSSSTNSSKVSSPLAPRSPGPRVGGATLRKVDEMCPSPSLAAPVARTPTNTSSSTISSAAISPLLLHPSLAFALPPRHPHPQGSFYQARQIIRQHLLRADHRV